MNAPLRGHCACGSVRIELSPPTIFASYCHCESCRRVHAAPFVAWTAVPREAFRLVAGDTSIAEYTSSPGTVRAFCRQCGSSLFYRADPTPDRIYVPVAILDAIDRPLDSHVSYEEHVPWLSGVHLLPCFVGKSDQPMAWDVAK
jgi:hypothetical protein